MNSNTIPNNAKKTFQDKDIKDRFQGLIHHFVAEANSFSNEL